MLHKLSFEGKNSMAIMIILTMNPKALGVESYLVYKHYIHKCIFRMFSTKSETP